MSKKTIKIESGKDQNPSPEYQTSYDLGKLIGTIQCVLRYTSTDEAAKRTLLKSLREVEHGDSYYSKDRIKQLEELADELGFEFES
jgi:hypothetical protein